MPAVRRENRALLAIIVAVVAVQLWLAHRYFGFLTGDDVEVLAEAFRVVLRFDYRPWDIRNLFIPDVVVAPVVFIGSKLAIHDPARLIELATLPFIAANALTIWLVHRLASRWTNDSIAGLAAAGLFAFHWIPLAFASTVYPRTIAALCVVAAALLATARESWPPLFAAGLLIGVAFADRFSEIIFLAPLLIAAAILAPPSKSSRLARVGVICVGAAVSISSLIGAYDWWTWGSPFSSVRKFADLTLIHPDFASRAKYQGALWYFTNVAPWCAFTLIPLFIAARRSTAAKAAALFALLPLIALSFVKHKEFRYLQGIVPFVAIAAAIGFAAMWRAGHRRWAGALLAMSLVWNVIGLRVLARKSMPSVMAARSLAADPGVTTVAMSQLWACGDRLYLGDKRAVIDVATPPRDLANGMRFADAIIMYETDLEDASVAEALHAHGFVARQTFRDGPARAVVVFWRK
jgi:Alg9-like mannosyltransferase family